MKKDWIIATLIFLVILFIWKNAFSNFFAQDDFIFIEYFSQNSLVDDFKNVFGPPVVTHWRPFHNLYFLIAGNLFGKNFALYHLLTLSVHIAAGFFIFKIVQNLAKSNLAALAAAIFYTVHPAHFVSMFWVAGAATVIGFLFFVISIWSFMKKQMIVSLIFFIFALLASEAMISGVAVFALLVITTKRTRSWRFLSTLVLTAVIFIFIKLIFTSPATFEIYKIEISTRTLSAVIYYILRIMGFAEVSGDKIPSIVLVILWGMILTSSSRWILKNPKQLLLPTVTGVVGLFPFILIPSHLSAHYMNLSIWGISMALAIVFKRLVPLFVTLFLVVFVIMAFININNTQKNNWVVKRSNLARTILGDIKTKNIAVGSTLIFSDAPVASSWDAYIALGQGKAIDFWFSNKNYKTCFTFLEDCPR